MGNIKMIQEAGVEEIIRLKEDGSYSLIGNKCKECGFITFPALKTCIKCGCQELEATELSKTGTLYTHSTTMRPVNHMPAGNISGYVDLDDGVRIFAPIDVADGDQVRIGAKIEVIFRPLWTEEDGTIVMGYAGKQEVE